MPVAFDEVVEKITDAARHVEADGGASPVLVAVVREFQAKLGKAEKQATDGVPGRDSVMELEQAGVGNLGDGVVRSDMTGTGEPLATTDLEIRVQRRQRRLVE